MLGINSSCSLSWVFGCRMITEIMWILYHLQCVVTMIIFCDQQYVTFMLSCEGTLYLWLFAVSQMQKDKSQKKKICIPLISFFSLLQKLLELPLYMKRMCHDMMNPDRPGAHLNKLRIFAVSVLKFLSHTLSVLKLSPLQYYTKVLYWHIWRRCLFNWYVFNCLSFQLPPSICK